MEQFIQDVIKEAGAMALGYFREGVEHTQKSNPGDLVTKADIAVSDFLIEAIQKEYPEHQITSEERDEVINPGGDYEWIMDPIDGTRNFAHGIPMWCNMLAVMKGSVPLFAVVYIPVANELFFAKKDGGAFLNGKQIHVNNNTSLDNAFGYVSRAGEEGEYGRHIERYQKAFTKVVNETTVWIHNFGTMAASCYLASGGIDFFAVNHGMDHDYVAPILIFEEAGAKVTNSFGEPWQRGQQDTVVANPELHGKIMAFFE